MRARAAQTLQELVDLFVMAQRWPVPFLPKPARLYAANMAGGLAPQKAFAVARKAYDGERFGGAKLACNARLMPGGLTVEAQVGGVELPDGWDFGAVACRVWDPVLDAMTAEGQP